MTAHRRLCLVLGDQLSFDLASLQAIDKDSDGVLLVEVMEEARYVPHHPQKIALALTHSDFKRPQKIALSERCPSIRLFDSCFVGAHALLAQF